MQKIITIFGGSGFIGRHVVKLLAGEGHDIRVCVRHPQAAKDLKTMGPAGQVTLLAAPLQNEAAIRAVIKGSDAVINLIGSLFESFDAVYVEGTQKIIRAIQDFHIPTYTHISALGADPNAASAYARTKGLAEKLVTDSLPNATILKPSLVIGQQDHFLSLFAKIIHFSPIVPLIGGGQTRFQPVYVGDLAEAIRRTTLFPHAQGKNYDIGGSDIYSLSELLHLLAEARNKKRIFLPMPWPLASLRFLKNESICDPTKPDLASLLINPTAIAPLIKYYYQD